MTPLCTTQDVTTRYPALASLTYLDSLIGVASEMIYAYLNASVETTGATVTESVSGGPLSRDLGIYGQSGYPGSIVFGSDYNFVELSNWPVASVQSVTDSQGNAVTDYLLLPASGLLYRANGWTPGVEDYTVTYTFGSAPTSLNHAAIMLTSILYNEQILSAIPSIKIRTLADSTIQYADPTVTPQLPNFVRLLLQPYRTLVIG